MMKSLGLCVSEPHYKLLMEFYEMSKQGLFKFSECNEILVEILMGHVFFSNAQLELEHRAQHYYNMAGLILYSDEIYETVAEIMEECREKDIENYKVVSPEIFENILWSYEDRFYEGELKELLAILYGLYRKGDEFQY